ncbi:MAG: YbaK/EbsC family protein [Anaerolineales bacterium]|nr:YbaK/EbsC family protein [Anaerolineales bacterium]
MRAPTNPTAITFQDTIRQHGLPGEVVEFEITTRTAADAAAAIGCELGQIVKSLIFRNTDDEGVIILTSGSNRVDEALVAEATGATLGKADADFVRTLTGYAIGGVPPFGYLPHSGNPHPAHTYIDEDLLQYAEVWAAAGTPHAVFPLPPDALVRISGGKVIRVHG